MKQNVVSSRDYKRHKYKNIADFGSTLAGNRKIYSNTVEISTMSFISNMNDFTKLIGVSHMPVQLKQKIISTVLRSSFTIYYNRTVPQLLTMPRSLSDSSLSTKLLTSLWARLPDRECDDRLFRYIGFTCILCVLPSDCVNCLIKIKTTFPVCCCSLLWAELQV